MALAFTGHRIAVAAGLITGSGILAIEREALARQRAEAQASQLGIWPSEFIPAEAGPPHPLSVACRPGPW